MIKNEKKIIHIIVPFFNSEKTIEKSLNSILKKKNNETNFDFKIILVNDGSTDSSLKICNKFKFDKDFELINLEINKGVSHARNCGLRKIKTSDFVVFLDADDELLDDFFINIERFICQGGLGVGQELFFTNNRLSKISKYFHKEKVISKFDILKYVLKFLKKPNFYGLFSYCWGRIYDFNIIRKHNIEFDESLSTFEDVEFNFQYLVHCFQINFIMLPIYKHNIADPGNSQTYSSESSISSNFGFIKALSQVEVFFNKSLINNRDSNHKIKNKIKHTIAAYTSIVLTRQCFRWKSIIVCIRKYPEIIKNLFKEFNLNNSFAFYNPTNANGSKILTTLLCKKLWTFAAIFLYIKFKKRY